MKPEDEKEIQDQVDRMVKHLSNEKHKAMKETEEIILKRIKANPKEIILCRQYHESMMQSSLPSEQEIVSQVRHSTVDPDYIYGYEAGVRKVLELLTKGDT